MRRSKLLIASLVLCVALIWHPVQTLGQIAGEVIDQAVDQIFKQATTQEMTELGVMGGKTAVREILDRAATEGGEQLVKEVVRYGVDDGPMALRAISRDPGAMVKALDELSPSLRGAALNAADRDPVIVTESVRQYGAGALEVAAERPGVGVEIVQKLGNDGIRLGRELSIDQSIVLDRNADEIAALAPADRSSVIAEILASPARALDFLEAHPKVLLTSAGVAMFLTDMDNIIGDKQGRTGLIDRLAIPVIRLFTAPAMIISSALAAGIAGWFAVHLRGKWQMQRLRHASELPSLANEAKAKGADAR